MSGFDNEVLYCTGERLELSSAQAITLMQQFSTDVSRVNNVGDPNNVVSANPSSICHDPISGFLYLKTSGVGTVGWTRILPSSSTMDSFTTDVSGPVVPAGGVVTVTGTNVYSDGTVGNTLTLNMQGAAHTLFVAQGTQTPSINLPTGSSLQILQSGGGAANPAWSTATYPATTTINQLLYSSANNTVSGLATANQSVLTTTLTGVPVATSLATNGQLIIGSTAGAPAAALLTSSDGSVTVTNGSNSISLTVSGGSSVGKTITGNTGGALSPSLGNWNLLGTGSITTVGSGSTLTTELTGLTNHAILVGAGTTTITNVGPTSTVGQILQSAGASSDPAFSTATYPSTTTINQLLYSSANNTVSELATANRAVLTTTAAGVPVATALATNGQLIIGSTAGAPAAATLTAGTGINITNASNSITISTVGAGLTWSDTSGTFTAVVDNGYFLTAASTPTLPVSPSEGDTIEFAIFAAATMTITANTGQFIRLGTAISAAAGTCVASIIGNTIKLVYRSSVTTWISTAAVGSWTIT